MKHIMTKICLATFHHKYKSFETLSDILHFPGNSKIFLNWQDDYRDRHGGKLLRCVCNISILIRRAYQISSSNKTNIRHLISCQNFPFITIRYSWIYVCINDNTKSFITFWKEIRKELYHFNNLPKKNTFLKYIVKMKVFSIHSYLKLTWFSLLPMRENIFIFGAIFLICIHT